MHADPGGLCVVGMHRSGTSLVMGVLRALGVELGPETSLIPSAVDDNPDGYLEQRAFVTLDDELLAALGGHTSDPAPSEPGWHAEEPFAGRQAEAAALVAATFTRAPWAWKDPRAALLLPFWRAVVPELRVLVCIRNPVEVAASMTRRHADYFDREHWLRMWLRYAADALAGSAGAERSVLLYDDLLAQPEREAARLGAFALGHAPAPDAVVRAAGLVRPGTRHHRVSDTTLASEAPPEVTAAYLAIRAAAGGGEPLEVAAQVTARLHAALGERDAGAEQVRREHEALATELERVRAQHARIAGSRSWRMTAPVRATAARLRARWHRGAER